MFRLEFIGDVPEDAYKGKGTCCSENELLCLFLLFEVVGFDLHADEKTEYSGDHEMYQFG